MAFTKPPLPLRSYHHDMGGGWAPNYSQSRISPASTPERASRSAVPNRNGGFHGRGVGGPPMPPPFYGYGDYQGYGGQGYGMYPPPPPLHQPPPYYHNPYYGSAYPPYGADKLGFRSRSQNRFQSATEQRDGRPKRADYDDAFCPAYILKNHGNGKSRQSQEGSGTTSPKKSTSASPVKETSAASETREGKKENVEQNPNDIPPHILKKNDVTLQSDQEKKLLHEMGWRESEEVEEITDEDIASFRRLLRESKTQLRSEKAWKACMMSGRDDMKS